MLAISLKLFLTIFNSVLVFTLCAWFIDQKRKMEAFERSEEELRGFHRPPSRDGLSRMVRFTAGFVFVLACILCLAVGTGTVLMWAYF